MHDLFFCELFFRIFFFREEENESKENEQENGESSAVAVAGRLLSFIGVPTDPMRPQLDPAGVDEEYAPILAACNSPAAPSVSAVAFNLFSLGGWHIAEALGVRCVALSPCSCLTPRPPPSPSPFARHTPSCIGCSRQALPPPSPPPPPPPPQRQVHAAAAERWRRTTYIGPARRRNAPHTRTIDAARESGSRAGA